VALTRKTLEYQDLPATIFQFFTKKSAFDSSALNFPSLVRWITF